MLIKFRVYKTCNITYLFENVVQANSNICQSLLPKKKIQSSLLAFFKLKLRFTLKSQIFIQ